jgi:hypothetical protein
LRSTLEQAVSPASFRLLNLSKYMLVAVSIFCG